CAKIGSVEFDRKIKQSTNPLPRPPGTCIPMNLVPFSFAYPCVLCVDRVKSLIFSAPLAKLRTLQKSEEAYAIPDSSHLVSHAGWCGSAGTGRALAASESGRSRSVLAAPGPS